MCRLEKTGQEQFDTSVYERLVTQSQPMKDPIKRNIFPLFSHPPTQVKSTAKHQLSSVKSDCSLVSSLYISYQTREIDLDEFFSHENQALPPFNDVTPAFCFLASTPTSVEVQLNVLECFVVLIYDQVSSEEKVNEVRRQLFSQKTEQ